MKKLYVYISFLLLLVACGEEPILVSSEVNGDKKYLQYKIDKKDVVIKIWKESDKNFNYVAEFKGCQVFDGKNWRCSREDIVPEALEMYEGVLHWSKGSMGNIFK